MTGKAHEANETTKRTPVENRKFKDTVFRMLFSDKEALLSLYNAINNSHYTDSGALEIVTLENAIYVAKVRSFTEQMPLDDAVQKALRNDKKRLLRYTGAVFYNTSSIIFRIRSSNRKSFFTRSNPFAAMHFLSSSCLR